jgi:hemin uptake protein HemP
LGKFIVPLSLAPSANPKANTTSTASPAVQPPPSGSVTNSGSSAGSVNSTDILKGEKAVAIHHNGLTYRLQATRLGKLILTK